MSKLTNIEHNIPEECISFVSEITALVNQLLKKPVTNYSYNRHELLRALLGLEAHSIEHPSKTGPTGHLDFALEDLLFIDELVRKCTYLPPSAAFSANQSRPLALFMKALDDSGWLAAAPLIADFSYEPTRWFTNETLKFFGQIDSTTWTNPLSAEDLILDGLKVNGEPK